MAETATETRPGLPRIAFGEDLIDVPEERRHDPSAGRSLRGIPLAVVLGLVGSAAMGAGYGAFLALCGERLVNIGLVCSFPFWMHVPSQLGFMWGHLHSQRWRSGIELTAFAVCVYAICVGWLAAVLDGPGVVLDPLRLIRYLSDPAVHGIWVDAVSVIDLTPELSDLGWFLVLIRAGEMLWIVFAGLMCLGCATPFPYCQQCRRWMDDSANLRLDYQPDTVDDVQALAANLVDENYDGLLQLDDPVESKAKGLDISVYSCPGCGSRHVMDLQWYPARPNEERSEAEKMLESAGGIAVVKSLKIPEDVKTHFAALAERSAA